MEQVSLLQFIRQNFESQITLVNKHGIMLDILQDQAVVYKYFRVNDFFVEMSFIHELVLEITPFKTSAAIKSSLRPRQRFLKNIDLQPAA